MTTQITQELRERISLIREAKKEKFEICEGAIRIYGGYKIIERDSRFKELGERVTFLSGPEDCYQMRVTFPYA